MGEDSGAEAGRVVAARPNKRLELAGAAKQGRLPFVRQLTAVTRESVRSARGLRARSSSAIR